MNFVEYCLVSSFFSSPTVSFMPPLYLCQRKCAVFFPTGSTSPYVITCVQSVFPSRMDVPCRPVPHSYNSSAGHWCQTQWLAQTKHSVSIFFEWMQDRMNKKVYLFCCTFGFAEAFGFFPFEYHSFILPLCLVQSIFIECLWCVRRRTTCPDEWDMSLLPWKVKSGCANPVHSESGSHSWWITSHCGWSLTVAVCGMMQRKKTLSQSWDSHSSWGSELINAWNI